MDSRARAGSAPRIALAYYKDAVDAAVRRFFEERGGEFAKRNGRYASCAAPSAAALERLFAEEAAALAGRLNEKFDPVAPAYLFLVGECEPRRGILYRSGGRFPAKLASFLESEPGLKYVLREKDIDLDARLFAAAADAAFARLFKAGSAGIGGAPNAFAVAHRDLDGHAARRAFMAAYGRRACSDARPGGPRCTTCVNDLVYMYSGRRAAWESAAFARAAAEVKQYADACMAAARARA